MRDTAEVFDQHAIDTDAVVEQARTILEDVTIAGWKVGFLGSAESVSAVAEVLSDYPDVPLVVVHAQPVAGSTTTSCSPTSTPSASWSCRPPRCWSATTRR